MTDTRRTATSQELVQAIRDARLNPRGYSGRSMYSRECVAFSSDDYLNDIAEVQAMLPEGINIPRLLTDQLGKGDVVYFPGVTWKEEND